MNNRAIVHVVVNIDTTKRIGESCIYGISEFQDIVKAGCNLNNYECQIAHEDELIKVEDREYWKTVAHITITPKENRAA